MVSREVMMKRIGKDEAVQESDLGSEAWWEGATDVAWHLLVSANRAKKVQPPRVGLPMGQSELLWEPK